MQSNNVTALVDLALSMTSVLPSLVRNIVIGSSASAAQEQVITRQTTLIASAVVSSLTGSESPDGVRAGYGRCGAPAGGGGDAADETSNGLLSRSI
jgi:hypothetical protein